MLKIMGLNKDRITSLELLDQINIFRKQEGNRAVLQHKDLLKIIRNEFEEEINEGKISLVEYKDKKGELRPMYILTYNQAKQVLLRESKFVRRAVIHYVERLEEELQKDFIEKYERQLLGFDELVKRNEELEYNNGNGKYYKSINNIKWLKNYWNLDIKKVENKVIKKLVEISNSLNIGCKVIFPTFSNKEVLLFHVKVYEEFLEEIKKIEDMGLVNSYINYVLGE